MGLVHAEPVARLQESVRPQVGEVIRAYFTLTKPRIVLLLLFTEYCAMVVTGGQLPSPTQTLVGLLGLALSAGGAAVINMWYDRDIDCVMDRTARRPLPTGMIAPASALVFGLVLGVASVLLLGLCANWLAAGLSLAGYLYYAVVYTMWLKRRTPQNIVIGGGAGAFPPLVGWAVVSGHIGITAILMFGVIFLWTPSHFWGLALYKNDDYSRAGLPMMPVVRGSRSTKRQMVVYSVLLLICSMALGEFIKAEMLYVVLAGVLGVWFLAINVRLLRDSDESSVWAKRTFFASLLYLPAIFTVMVVCSVI